MNSGKRTTNHVSIVPAQTHSDPTLATLGFDFPHDVVAIDAGANRNRCVHSCGISPGLTIAFL